MVKKPILTSRNVGLRKPPTLDLQPHEKEAQKQADYAKQQTREPENFDFKSESMRRLRRIETRVVSGFESLGVSTTKNHQSIDVQAGAGVITITSLGTTVKELVDAIGLDTGTYDVVYNGKTKCEITVE